MSNRDSEETSPFIIGIWIILVGIGIWIAFGDHGASNAPRPQGGQWGTNAAPTPLPPCKQDGSWNREPCTYYIGKERRD